MRSLLCPTTRLASSLMPLLVDLRTSLVRLASLVHLPPCGAPGPRDVRIFFLSESRKTP